MSLAGLIVGLGNPGRQYEGSRHNLGFMAVDALLREVDASSESGSRFRCELWKCRFPGGGVWLVAKPQTFMNLSGEAVQPLAAWHRLPVERILVVHDELDLAPGRMKFKRGGGNAGHNGLKSIASCLGSPDFYRLRLGIGRSPYGGQDTVNWVLGRPSAEDRQTIEAALPTALQVIRLFVAADMEGAAREANAFRVEASSPGGSPRGQGRGKGEASGD